MSYITGRLERLSHASEGTWRIKLQGCRAVTVTPGVLEGVWLDYRTSYAITLDETPRALDIEVKS